MSFWMATGSGKSLVIIKIVQFLLELIKRGEVPSNDILMLCCKDIEKI
jgi:type I site-specific restriction-modification system R (restriction) subunit